MSDDPKGPAPAPEEPHDESLLIEEAASAWRPLRLDQLRSHPAWHDLSPAGRAAAFALAFHNRRLEAALDPEGMNQTVRAVMQQIQQTTSEPGED